MSLNTESQFLQEIVTQWKLIDLLKAKIAVLKSKLATDEELIKQLRAFLSERVRTGTLYPCPKLQATMVESKSETTKDWIDELQAENAALKARITELEGLLKEMGEILTFWNEDFPW